MDRLANGIVKRAETANEEAKAIQRVGAEGSAAFKGIKNANRRAADQIRSGMRKDPKSPFAKVGNMLSRDKKRAMQQAAMSGIKREIQKGVAANRAAIRDEKKSVGGLIDRGARNAASRAQMDSVKEAARDGAEAIRKDIREAGAEENKAADSLNPSNEFADIENAMGQLSSTNSNIESDLSKAIDQTADDTAKEVHSVKF